MTIDKKNSIAVNARVSRSGTTQFVEGTLHIKLLS